MDVSIEEFEDQMMAFFEAPQARCSCDRQKAVVKPSVLC